MTYDAIVRDIARGQLYHIYLLHGEEKLFSSRLEQAIVRALLPPDERDINLRIFEGDPSLEELITCMETVPFLGACNVIVVRNSILFGAKKGAASKVKERDDALTERLLDLLSDMPEFCRILFIADDKVDKRKKIYKVIEKCGIIAELAPLKGRDVKPWILSKLDEHDKKMTDDALEYLLAIVSIMPQVSAGFLSNEIDKAALYVNDKKTISRADLIAVLSSVPEVSVFTMLEAISNKQAIQALHIIGEQIAAGEHPIRLLALLSRHIRQLWQARELIDAGCSSTQAAAMLQVPPFIGEKLLRQSRAFSLQSLKTAFLRLAAADYDLKSGKANSAVLERIIIEMCA